MPDQYRVTLSDGTVITVTSDHEPTMAEAQAAYSRLTPEDHAKLQTQTETPATPPPPVAGRGTQYNAANAPANVEMLRHFMARAAPVAAGLALAPVTEGMSIPAAMAIQGAGAGTAAVAGNAIEGKPIDPKAAGLEALLNGLTEGGLRGATAAYKATAPMLKAAGTDLYTRVMKPLTSTLEGVGERWGSADDLAGRAKNIAASMMDQGLNVGQRGLQKLIQGVRASTAEGDQIIKDSTAMASTAPARGNLAQGAEDALFKDEATQRAWQRQARELERNPHFSDEAVTEAGPTRVPREQVPVQIAQARKQGLTSVVGDDAFGKLSSGQKQAMKAEAAGHRAAIDTAVPEMVPVNARTGQLIDMRDVMGDAAKRTGNVNMVDLPTIIAASHAFTNPLLAATVVNRPLIGSPVARFLYNAGKAAPGVENTALGNLYRTMMLAHLTGTMGEQDDTQQTPPNQ